MSEIQTISAEEMGIGVIDPWATVTTVLTQEYYKESKIVNSMACAPENISHQDNITCVFHIKPKN